MKLQLLFVVTAVAEPSSLPNWFVVTYFLFIFGKRVAGWQKVRQAHSYEMIANSKETVH